MAIQKSSMGLSLCISITTAAMGFYALWASNVWPEAWCMLLLGFVFTAWATWLTLAKLRGSQKQAMLLPLVVECSSGEGDGMEQEENTLVFNVGADEAKEEPASDAPQKPLAMEEVVPFKRTSSRRAQTSPTGCFSMQGLFTNSKKK